MTAAQIAKIVGTVGSPLIVISELLKNAVDASAKNIDIYYDSRQNLIIVENDYKGFSVEEIEELSMPGKSSKKAKGYLTNEPGMFLTGSKGLGLLSVFLLCEETEIVTVPSDEKVHRIILNKTSGTVEDYIEDQSFVKHFTRITLKNVDSEVVTLLSSESEVRKLRHICTYLYKNEEIPFPKIQLHITGQEPMVINFSCVFPAMLYDVCFNFQKESGNLNFRCYSPDKLINTNGIVLTKFGLAGLQEAMLTHYGIRETIPTRTNDNELMFSCFDEVPSFEGRIVVYEKSLAGAQLKTYGAGVNIYVNDFALYNYLAEENDWLGLADYSQRKKVTRLKPHNVFGYVNFPQFDENIERLQISNERADFIQDFTFSKLMYLLKGVVMFVIFNVDVADKNPKYKNNSFEDQSGSEPDNATQTVDNSSPPASDDEQGESDRSEAERKYPVESSNKDFQGTSNSCSSESAYRPKKYVPKHLEFTGEEGQIINGLKGINDLSNKICSVVFELSKLELQVHRYSVAYLYRALLESSTKYLFQHQSKVLFNRDSLESSIISALDHFANISKKGIPLSQKTIKAWRDTVSKRKLIDTLNEYIHNELPVDTYLLQETWNTMKGYVIACLTIS